MDSMDKELWVILAIGLGVMVTTVLLVMFFSRLRIKAMKAAGTALGLIPLNKGETFAYAPVELMRKKGRGIGVGLRGHWQGQPVLVFDLFHPSGRSVSMQTVMMLQRDDWHFPEFAAIERNANYYVPTVDLQKVADAPGDLGKHWHLYSRDGHWPFGPALGEWLGKNRGRRGWYTSGWSFEGNGHALYVYRRSSRPWAGQLAGWLDEALSEAREFARRAETVPGIRVAEESLASPQGDILRVKTTTTFHFEGRVTRESRHPQDGTPR